MASQPDKWLPSLINGFPAWKNGLPLTPPDGQPGNQQSAKEGRRSSVLDDLSLWGWSRYVWSMMPHKSRMRGRAKGTMYAYQVQCLPGAIWNNQDCDCPVYGWHWQQRWLTNRTMTSDCQSTTTDKFPRFWAMMSPLFTVYLLKII